MPDAPYVLSREDKVKFLQNLRNIRCLTGYVLNLYNKISDGKIGGLKSHDYHIV
jgi:hypothetical protein